MARENWIKEYGGLSEHVPEDVAAYVEYTKRAWKSRGGGEYEEKFKCPRRCFGKVKIVIQGCGASHGYCDGGCGIEWAEPTP